MTREIAAPADRRALTVCEVPVDSFKTAPTPAELAAIVARWKSDEQAEFIALLAEQLRFACGDRVFMQWQYIAESLNAREEELCSGYGSELLRELNDRLDATPPVPSTPVETDMLDALKVAEPILNGCDMGGMSCGTELQKVRDAIAKAEGRS